MSQVWVQIKSSKTCFVFRSRRGGVSAASFRRGRSRCLRVGNPAKYSDKENFARNCIFETSSNWGFVLGRGLYCLFQVVFFISALWTTNWEKWGLNQFKRSILITISDTLDENEGCNHPDHWEEVEGHDGIGDGSGVECVQLRWDHQPEMRGMAVVLTLLSLGRVLCWKTLDTWHGIVEAEVL